MKFGDMLHNLIDEKDITQKELANDLDLAPSTMGGYFQNRSQPDFETLKKMAQYFDVSIDYLLSNPTSSSGTQGESEVLRIYRSLTEEQKILYIEQGKAFIRFNEDKKLPKFHEKKKSNL